MVTCFQKLSRNGDGELRDEHKNNQRIEHFMGRECKK